MHFFTEPYFSFVVCVAFRKTKCLGTLDGVSILFSFFYGTPCIFCLVIPSWYPPGMTRKKNRPSLYMLGKALNHKLYEKSKLAFGFHLVQALILVVKAYP
jgi:hypothetical protein